MKNLFVVLFVVISVVLLAELTETKTIIETQFLDLKDACCALGGIPGSGSDEVMTWYHYKSIDPNRDEEEDGLGEELRVDFIPLSQASYYSKLALLGAIGRGYIDDDTWFINLNRAHDYLLDQGFIDPMNEVYPDEPMYLDLDLVWNEYLDGSGSDCLNYGSVLNNVAFIVDMLWYYDNGAYQADLEDKLNNLAGWAYLLLNDELPKADPYNGTTAYLPTNYPSAYPEFPNNYPDHLDAQFHNYRIRLAGALGYAGCVLGNEEFIRIAEQNLFDYIVEDENFLGLLPHLTTNSGTFAEGMSYTEYTFEGLTKFFVARKRLTFDFAGIEDNKDWFSDDRVKDIYTNSLDLTGSDLSWIPFDDTHITYIKSNGYFYSVYKYFSEIVSYFYQSPESDQENRNYIKWLINNFHSNYSDYYFCNWNLNKFYSYNTDRTLAGFGSTPENLSNGTYSNEELTILRRPINSYYDLEEYPVLVVNHENSHGRTGHEHSDQSSFILYHKGRQLLIDPGYRPSWSSYFIGKEWLTSSFAHNVIMVNPHDQFYNREHYWEESELEEDYWNPLTHYEEQHNVGTLWEYWNDIGYNDQGYSVSLGDPNNYDFYQNKFEPIGRSGSWDDNEPKNPALKNLLTKNNNIEHLQVEILYDHPHGYIDDIYYYPPDKIDDIVTVKRNYYSLDIKEENPYFIIYDEIESSDPNIENVFMNQLHFAPHPVPNHTPYNGIDELIHSNGEFTYNTYDDQLYLFGVMGGLYTNDESCWTALDNLPVGLYYKSEWDDTFLPPQWEHRCLRVNSVTNVNEQFLTLLIPSENDTTPINDISPGSGQYAAKYSLNTGYNCYAAVSDGNDVYCNGGNTRFVTDASFLLVEANNIFTDLKKLILNSDNFLEVRDMGGTDFTNVVVFDSDYDAEEIIAEWTESNELEITILMSFTSPIPLPIPNPKYKILRCGVLPEDLISKTHYYSSGDTTPQERGTIGNNIENLAYDDNYFYVNYGYSDLVSENLLTEELTIHQGVFDGITIQGVTQFGTGDIVLKNEIPVPFGTEIVFLPGSQPQLYSNFHLIVDGNLTALGTDENNIIFDKYSSTNWKKIEITNTGNANMEFCKFLNAQFPLYNKGYVNIENCEFFDNSGGIYLDNPTGYQINHSIINNCSYGILIKDSHILMHRSAIKNNLITNNNYGLWFYNASGYVEADTIFANKYVGIMANRGSNPVIVGSSISSTYYNENNYPEIKIGGSSYPIVDRNENDIIFGNGHSIYNMDIEPRDYRCSENWWGTTNELSISNSFYPLNWLIDFTPISLSPNVGYNPWSGGSLFEEGLLAESNGDLITAKTKYVQSIEENSEGIEALWSVSRLINCSETEMEYADLLQYYNQLQIDYTETDLAKAAKLDEVFCNRLLGNYQDAITEYEFLLNENLTFIDSVFTQLDIVYTYMEASSGDNRANVTFQNSNNSLSSVKQAKEREVELWGLLENQITDGGIYSPEISKSILHRNYPNPFNPSTTISFSIPEQSKIQIMIYNIKGQKVKTVTNESFDKGIHSVVWNGVDDSGKAVSSGVYFYNLNVNGKSKAIKKCLLLK